MKNFKKFITLDIKTQFLLLEALFLLGWARFLKSIRFSIVAPYLGEHMQETSFEVKKSNNVTLECVSKSINTMSQYTFWESKCLVKAIAAMKMLERRNIESTLYLGTAKDRNGKLIAHAWLRSGTFYLTGFEGMDKFTTVSKFAKKL